MASIASPPSGSPLLALDSGSPVTSVAVATPGRPPAERHSATRTSSAELLRLIDAALTEACVRSAQLGGVIALRGPGSFTGLRVGLATALGLHQALRVPAAGPSTLRVLAASARPARPIVVAVVDALRGEWFAQPFTGREPLEATEEPRRLRPREIAAYAPCDVIGFGAQRLAETPGWPAGPIRLREAGPLASVALGLAAEGALTWDATALSRPLYLRSAAARPPDPA